MLSCIKRYTVKVSRSYGTTIAESDTLEEAIKIANELYKRTRNNNNERYFVECWDDFYNEFELVECLFNSICWDSDNIPPWED